jgi:hypothetical protein
VNLHGRLLMGRGEGLDQGTLYLRLVRLVGFIIVAHAPFHAFCNSGGDGFAIILQIPIRKVSNQVRL